MRARAAPIALSACLAIVVSVSPAAANVGVYFDSAASLNSIFVPSWAPFSAYIVLTESPVNAVDGAQLAYSLRASHNPTAPVLRISQDVYGATGAIGTDALSGEYVLSWATPRPAGSALVLVSWQLVLTADDDLDICLAEVADPWVSDGMPEIQCAGTVYSVPIVLACFVSGHGDRSAVVNEDCQLPLEYNSWGAAKATYR
jgi:hypothetical protein